MDGGLDQTGQGGPAEVERNGMGHIPKSSLVGFTERLDMVYDEFNT